jgi:outer membrane receptor protein involved in Fe transport
MRFYALLLTLLLGTCVYAQDFTLSLRAIDNQTEETLPFLSVQLSPGGASGTMDERGQLKFKLRGGQYTIRASFTGYAEFEEVVLLEGDRNFTIRMEPTSEVLETVVVTDQDARLNLSRPQMGVERLSAQELESIPTVLGERDVLRSLQLLPGVSAAGEASNGISVRGGTLDQNLLLLDGAPVFTPTHLFGLFTVFTPDAVGGIDLYRGNIPARFGGRVSSVVDVRSRTPNSESLILKGGIGLVSSNLSVETPIGKSGKWNVLLAGRGGFNDFAFSLVDRLQDTKSRFGDATLKLRYRPSEKDLVTLTGFYSQDFYQVDLLATFGGVAATSNQYAYLTLNGGLEWTRLINDKLSWSTQVTNAHYAPELRFPQLDGENIINFASSIDQQTIRTALSGDENAQHAWTFGLQADQYTLDPGRLDPGGSTSVRAINLDDERGQELTAFVEDTWTVNERLTIGAGLRFTYYRQLGPGENRIYTPGAEVAQINLESTESFGSGETISSYGGFEPRLGISYQVGANTSLKASYARSRQYLQNIFNATTPLPTSRWKVADPNIGPQTANLVSAGISHVTADGNYAFRLETYYRQLIDLLDYKPGADFFLNPAVETDLLRGEGRAYGVELTANRRAGRLTGEINYAFARVENRVDGQDFGTRINRGEWFAGYFDQPHTFSANLILDQGKTHELGFNFVVQSNRPYTVPNGFVDINGTDIPLFLERNNARLPLYHRLDFSWTITNLKRQQRDWTGEWVFTVYNIYGRDNAYNIFFQPRDAGTPPLGIFSGSPFAAYRLSIFGAPVLSLAYKFTFTPTKKK